jgi:simple sugar transport system permease protein
MGVPSALIDVVQTVVILFLITAEFFKNYAIDVTLRRGPGPAEPGRLEGDV